MKTNENLWNQLKTNERLNIGAKWIYFNCLLFGAKSFTGKLHYLAQKLSQTNVFISPKLIHRQNHYLANIYSQAKYYV
jgi:hypothetical protein